MASVAREAGVATSTVSKALREDPSIPVERRRELQALAKALGYRPNPLVSALMARLHSRRRRNDPYHIAWIDLWPDDEEAAQTTDFRRMLRGARERAETLGYKIEVHRAARDGTSPERLHGILVSRSQWGLIIPPVPKEYSSYPLPLDGLTGVTIGTSLHHPAMHRVASNLFQGSQLACRMLRARGYRRIGLALSPSMNERVERKWLAAFLAEQAEWPSRERIPPVHPSEDDEKGFVAWWRRHTPEVVLLAESFIDAWVARLSGHRSKKIASTWLRRIETMRRNTFAIDTRPDRMGAAAVELVVGQIHRNERGCPPIPHTLLLDGIWCD